MTGKISCDINDISIEARTYLIDGETYIKVGVKITGRPSEWKAIGDEGRVLAQGTNPDTWLMFAVRPNGQVESLREGWTP